MGEVVSGLKLSARQAVLTPQTHGGSTATNSYTGLFFSTNSQAARSASTFEAIYLTPPEASAPYCLTSLGAVSNQSACTTQHQQSFK